MAVVEDRSAEEERDLAQLEIGALMDTAGVGVATFDSRARLAAPARRAPPARAGQGGGAAGDRARHRRARIAARVRAAAAGAAPRRARRGALRGAATPSSAGAGC